MTGPSRGLVVVAEDEPAISGLLSLYLTREGFDVHVEADGAGALAAIRQMRPSVVLLDVGLPVVDGAEVFGAMRAAGDWTPVIFCTARDEEVDRVRALEAGADDYVTKPFSPREVVARIKAVLRRTSGSASPQEPLVVGPVVVDRQARRCTVAGNDVALTPTEFELLARLMSQPGRVFSREELLADFRSSANAAGSRTVDVHVAQIRAKIGEGAPIRTVRGIGYVMDLTDTEG